jgi:hypothetical protein
MILQTIVQNRIRKAGTGIETVTTVFSFGPLKFVVTANIPDDEDSGTSYVKLELVATSDDREPTPRWAPWEKDKK